MLSEGYSMLHTDAGSFDTAQLILYVKVESKAVDEIVTAVGEASDRRRWSSSDP